jgi:hypothetical protein
MGEALRRSLAQGCHSLGGGDGLASSTSARGEVDCAARPPYYVRVGAAASPILSDGSYSVMQNIEDQLKQGTEISCEAAGVVNSWQGCLLKEEMLRFEADLIKRALEAANGHITPAARLLGVSHQSLAAILQGRHKNLLSARTPVRMRKRSIIRTSSRKRFL